MILSLITAQRGQSIHLLDMAGRTLTSESCQFQLLEHTNTSQPKNSGLCIRFSKFTPDSNICPVKTLTIYLKRTQHLLQDTTKVFLSYVKPFKPVSRDTISRWLKMVLHNAGIDTTIFKSHSIRAASCSKASSRSVPVDSIMKAAGWSSETTFQKFYNKPIRDRDLTFDLLS